jgi:tRNA threonylcarbamoyladenosine biosynthesis protein TsaB
VISLAIDTSAELCAVALHDGTSDEILAEHSLEMGRGHAEHLMQLISDLLAKCGLEYATIGRIFCAAGPGSFTGVRIGLSAARGLGLALECPAYGLNNLEALAEAAIPFDDGQKNGPLLAALDARRGEAYCQLFGPGDTAASQPFRAGHGHDERIERIIRLPDLSLCGSGAPIIAARTGTRARILHELSAAPITVYCRIGANRADARLPPDPIYLRGPDAKPQKVAVHIRQ